MAKKAWVGKYLGIVTVSVTFVFLITVCISLWRQSTAIQKLTGHIETVHDAAAELEEIRSSVLQAETADRGYSIAGDPDYLTDFENASQNLKKEIGELKHIQTVNNNQKLPKLFETIDKKIAFMNQSIALCKTKGTQAAWEHRKSGLGRVLMNDISIQISKLKQEQLASIHSESTQIKTRSRLALIFFSYLSLITATLAILFFYQLTKHLNERNKAENEIARINNLLESIVGSIGDGIVACNKKGEFILFNPAATELLGKGAIQTRSALWPKQYGLYQSDMVNLLEEKDLPLVRALSGQSVDNFEIFIQNQSKPEGIWVEVTSRPLKDKKGDIIGGVAALRDVSVSKRAESVLMELNSKLQESNEQLQQFAYTASHDLQEPLRVIASFSELLESKYKDKLDKDATDYIEFITSAASRMQNLISDLLAYSRISTQAQTLAPSNISQALKAALANLQLVIEEKNAKISFDEIPPVLADEKQIVQVFQNLISNALKFCDHSNPEISISANKNMGMVTIAIKDNGIGIDTKFKDKIFDMFKRLHAVGKYPGTGMGLSICKKIVERHKGRIWAESEPGHGSTFYFTLKAAGTLEALDTDSPEAD